MKEYNPPEREDLVALIGEKSYNDWFALCKRIDEKYDMERTWNCGGKKWLHEYKYRRGGKTLCALYARENACGFMVILGQEERKCFEADRRILLSEVCDFYDAATTYHDGKWIIFPIDETFFDDYMHILKIKRKPNKK